MESIVFVLDLVEEPMDCREVWLRHRRGGRTFKRLLERYCDPSKRLEALRARIKGAGKSASP